MSWRAAVRKAAVYALDERRRWAHSTIDQHCVARAVAYQDMAATLIRVIDQMDAAPPTTTSAPTEDLPAGTPVLAFLDSRRGRALVTRTRLAVGTRTRLAVGTWQGQAVVWVDGRDHPIALTHIEVLP